MKMFSSKIKMHKAQLKIIRNNSNNKIVGVTKQVSLLPQNHG